MRTLFVLPVMLLLGVGVCACGGGGGSANAASKGAGPASPTGIPRPDYDRDDGRPVDDDSASLHTYGHDAGRPEGPLIAVLVRRYFAAAATGDGARGCTMITPALAKGMPVDFGVYGQPYLHGGKTCATILSRIFKHERRKLYADAREVKVTGVRIEGVEGFAFVDRGKEPEHLVPVQRVGGGWKLSTLEDRPIGHIE